MIRLVVFDWDGTLMDSEARIVTAMQRAFADADATPPGRAAVREIIGLDLGHAVAHLGPTLDRARQGAVVHAYRAIYAGLHAIPSPLFAGAADTLRALDASGLMLAVATGKSRRGLERALDEAGVRGHFVATRCGEELAPKPDPAMLRDILLELDTPPGEALMLGDTEFDLLMANAAATRSGAVTYGAHERARLLALAPDLVIDDLRDLPTALARLNDELSLR